MIRRKQRLLINVLVVEPWWWGRNAGKLLTVEFEGSAWGESREKLFHWERRIYSANARRQTRVADMNVGAPSGLLEALENMTRTLGFAFARDTLALARPWERCHPGGW